MNYFRKLSYIKIKNWISFRKKNNNFNNIIRGDIISITFWSNSYNYYFEGICISLKKQSLKHINTFIILKNVLSNIGIELTGPYFSNRLFLNKNILDYKRKKMWYKPSKLYYLREK
jgi:ribosomal protein L19